MKGWALFIIILVVVGAVIVLSGALGGPRGVEPIFGSAPGGES